MENKSLPEIFSYLPQVEEELKQMQANPETVNVDRLLEILDQVMGNFENIKSIEQDEN
jgi:hypothetical protein